MRTFVLSSTQALMKTWIFAFCVSAAALSACDKKTTETTTETTKVDSTATATNATGVDLTPSPSDSTYGKKISYEGAITTEEMLKKLEGKDSVQVKLVGDVQAVCQKRGCWMDIKLPNEEAMKVRFKDYAFFVPKDADGKKAIMEGWAKRETISVADQQHYAQDAGQKKDEIAAIKEPKTSYTFEADGVILKN
jgi:hypothetical protein